LPNVIKTTNVKLIVIRVLGLTVRQNAEGLTAIPTASPSNSMFTIPGSGQRIIRPIALTAATNSCQGFGVLSTQAHQLAVRCVPASCTRPPAPSTHILSLLNPSWCARSHFQLATEPPFTLASPPPTHTPHPFSSSSCQPPPPPKTLFTCSLHIAIPPPP
jgi:hypothetical protein